MAAKTKKIYFPGQVAEATPFVDNIDEKLNIGGLGAKYGINPVDMAKSMDFKTNIPVKITQAESAMATAQALNNSKDETIAYKFKCSLSIWCEGSSNYKQVIKCYIKVNK